MYNRGDLDNITKQVKKTIILLLASLIFFIIISIIAANLLHNWLGMIMLVLGVCIIMFTWGMYATPIFAYSRFIRELVTGRTREIQGLVKNLSKNPVYKDNKLYFYELNIVEDGIERMLLLDDQKDWPQIQPNKVYNFQIHESFITDFNLNP